jgi:AcrR family transcriptional regulator
VLIEEGSDELSVRRVAAVSGCNVALVSYYFGNLQGLLRAITELNLNHMVLARRKLLQAVSRGGSAKLRLRQLLEAYLRPMWISSVACGLPSAAIVMEESMSVAEPELRNFLVDVINASVEETCAVAAPLLPHLDHHALLVRLRLLLGATRAAQPRPFLVGLFDVQDLSEPQPTPDTLDQMMRFAEGAMLAR